MPSDRDPIEPEGLEQRQQDLTNELILTCLTEELLQKLLPSPFFHGQRSTHDSLGRSFRPGPRVADVAAVVTRIKGFKPFSGEGRVDFGQRGRAFRVVVLRVSLVHQYLDDGLKPQTRQNRVVGRLLHDLFDNVRDPRPASRTVMNELFHVTVLEELGKVPGASVLEVRLRIHGRIPADHVRQLVESSTSHSPIAQPGAAPPGFEPGHNRRSPRDRTTHSLTTRR